MNKSLNIINEKTGVVITSVAALRWEADKTWQARIRKNLTTAGFTFRVEAAQ